MKLPRAFGIFPLAVVIAAGYGPATRSTRVLAENRHPIQVTLIEDGKSRPLSTEAADVSGILEAAGVTVASPDEVRPPLTCRAFSGMTINVNRSQTRVETVKSVLPIPLELRRTVHLMPGRRQEARAGMPGEQEQEIRITSLGGREISRTVLHTTILHKPTSRIVLAGANPFMASRGMTGLRRCITLCATKYDMYLGGAGSGRTCTGMRARRGIVAVDPRVIPLGTHLYVEGYGFCVAADTGGAIKGHRIDLCVESPREANTYGRRQVKVFLLQGED